MKIFRFKKFNCSHGRGSMKIGVDAVLLGAWTDVGGVSRALDVGTGCGVIALLLAQRIEETLGDGADFRVDAIDIDPPSVEEADGNFKASPWSSRLHATLTAFSPRLLYSKYDLILSNPPYFDSGVSDPQGSRMVARHQGELSPSSLLRDSLPLLAPGGRIALVLPYEQADQLIEVGESLGLALLRRCDVRGHKDAPLKRSLLEFGVKELKNDGVKELKNDGVRELERGELILEESPGVPTDAYRRLCGPYYLSPRFNG